MSNYKESYVKQEIRVDAEDNSLCSPKCIWFVDAIRYPLFEAKCKLFSDMRDLSLAYVKMDKFGHPVERFSRCQGCEVKEIKDGAS